MSTDYRALLTAELDSTRATLAQLDIDVDDLTDSREVASADDEHDPEGATLAFERSQLTALIEEAHGRIGEITAAIARLDAGTYGRCEVGGEPIPAARLSARPWARTCVQHAARVHH